ncbi:2'-5' RNA ligase family protein [Treponema sp.]|uniref:2'-5' RNA ligase family protein n=1 Tax=Treponema sp. TaxID=166 RepID=UPI0025D19D75|nr:2'-5' RNA ligase family protein [Treponema sp.]MBR4321045.1 2'-5' RNA ligase family protein [Treponema sp.]
MTTDSPSRPETYAVSLLLDARSSQAIRFLQQDFASVTGNDVLIKKNAPVHLTLGMFHVSEDQIPELKSLFSDFASSLEKKLSLDFCGIDSFKEKVIFLSVNKNDKSSSAEKGSSFEILKALNARLHHSFLPHFEVGGNRNYIPENFFPHIALAVKLTEDQFEKGMNWAQASCTHSVPHGFLVTTIPCAKVTYISLARCHPYEEIMKIPLTDSLNPEQRHKNMAAIHSTGGKLEVSLRSQLFKFGFRFRKNDKRLTGKPDIVFPHYKAVIFVNGCFWHAHGWEPSRSSIISAHANGATATYAHGWKSDESLIRSPILEENVLYSLKCDKFRMPTTNPEFWLAKFSRNRERDLRDIEKLLGEGWRVGVVWECSITGRLRKEKIRSVAEKISLWLEEGYSEVYREF